MDFTIAEEQGKTQKMEITSRKQSIETQRNGQNKIVRSKVIQFSNWIAKAQLDYDDE